MLGKKTTSWLYCYEACCGLPAGSLSFVKADLGDSCLVSYRGDKVEIPKEMLEGHFNYVGAGFGESSTKTAAQILSMMRKRNGLEG